MAKNFVEYRHNLYYNNYIIWGSWCLYMENLIEFLQKEVPSNAGDLNNSINTTLEIIERTRAAVSGSVPKLYQNGRHDEVSNFTNADRQLMEIENYLKGFVGITHINNSEEQLPREKECNQTVEIKPNYDSYKVDETEPHNLDEDFTNKRPICFSLEGKKYSVRNWNRLLIMVCEILSQKNPKLFQSFPDDESMQGRTRTYFSRKQMKYACKKVGGTDIYVLTNNNGNGNCSIIIKMLEKYNIPTTSMEIFLKADYSPLHNNDDENESDLEENVKKN